jgi:PleD family two-component response regulator
MFMPSHHVTISCGICEVELDTRAKADELFRKADELMYQAKKGGKNQVVAI